MCLSVCVIWLLLYDQIEHIFNRQVPLTMMSVSRCRRTSSYILKPWLNFLSGFSIPGHLLKRIGFFISVLEHQVSLHLHTRGSWAFKLFEIPLLLICRHTWHKLWSACVFIINHLHSSVQYKALKLEMPHTCFVYDKDLFTPWLKLWEKEFLIITLLQSRFGRS